jgi:hypothetical protein
MEWIFKVVNEAATTPNYHSENLRVMPMSLVVAIPAEEYVELMSHFKER